MSEHHGRISRHDVYGELVSYLFFLLPLAVGEVDERLHSVPPLYNSYLERSGMTGQTTDVGVFPTHKATG